MPSNNVLLHTQGVVWQDEKTKTVYATFFDRDMKEHKSIVLLATRGTTVADGQYYALLAADSNAEGESCCLPRNLNPI